MENETVIVEEKRLKEDIDKLDSGARERYFHLLLKEQTEQTKKQKSFVHISLDTRKEMLRIASTTNSQDEANMLFNAAKDLDRAHKQHGGEFWWEK